MRIYLIGYMGSGKSTLGPKLANIFGVPFLDLDGAFEEKYRISIYTFFTKYGEQQFRSLEGKLLRDLSKKKEFVISTGGGTPCFEGNLDFMNSQGITVYLRLTPEVLLSRLKKSPRKRPLLDDMNDQELSDYIRKHLEKRETVYQKAKLTCYPMYQDRTTIADMIQEFSASIS